MSDTAVDIKKLEKLGFKKAASETKKIQDLKFRMTMAYGHYSFIRPENIEKFNARLRQETTKQHGSIHTYVYDRLKFTPHTEYDKVPPADVLDKLSEAMDRGCFDRFEVCTIEAVEVRPDPIIFGVIENCVDKFLVAQWDNDVKFEDIAAAK